jgi:hypothetical protein
MLVDYFNGCARASSFGNAAHKIMGEPSLISTCLFGFYVRLPSEKYKIVSLKNKTLKTSKIC